MCIPPADKNFDVASPKSRFTRAYYFYGAPLEGYPNFILDKGKQVTRPRAGSGGGHPKIWC